MFFYNEYTPSVIGCLWRPDAFKGQAFSAMYSEYKRPIDNQWVENSLVITNTTDIMRAIQFIVRDIVVDVKILDKRGIKNEAGNEEKHNSKRARPLHDNSSEEKSSDDE